MLLVQCLQQLPALLVQSSDALAEHRDHVVPRHGAALVHQTDQQCQPLVVACDLAHIRRVGHPRLAGEVRDLARRDALQPHLGRLQRVQRRQVRQALLELADRRGLRRGLQPVELAAPCRRVDQQQPFQPCSLRPARSGRDHAEHAAVYLGADGGGHRVQRGVAGQLAALPHQLVQRHVDQIGRVVLGLHRLANRGIGYLPYPCGEIPSVPPIYAGQELRWRSCDGGAQRPGPRL